MGMLVTMPRYGANMEEGIVAEWMVEECDTVQEGDALCEIEIEKLTNELESPDSGVLRKILCPEGEARECGAAIAVIAAADEDISGLIAEAGSSPNAKISVQEGAGGVEDARTRPSPGMDEEDEPRITPRARKLAKEKGVDYINNKIEGSGFHDAITRQDIKDFIAAGGATDAGGAFKTAPAAATQTTPQGADMDQPGSVPMSSVRRATARAMMKSVSETAQTSIMMDAQVDELVQRYNELKPIFAEEGIKLSYTAIAVKAAAVALVEHPEIRTIQAGAEQIKTLTAINIGVAVDSGQGLMVPVLRDCNTKELKTLCRELSVLADGAKSGSLGSNDFGGAALSLSNVGMYGVRYFTPILNPPESAIIGLGTLQQEALIRDGGIFPAWVWALNMTYDHRLIDGAPAARFLASFRDALNRTV
ncbi:MAG: dihydrolipoamide acetyltransferase family protein [Spirochaetia bacterium]